MAVQTGVVRDLAAIVAVVVLAALLGTLLPRCSFDINNPTPVTTSTTE